MKEAQTKRIQHHKNVNFLYEISQQISSPLSNYDVAFIAEYDEVNTPHHADEYFIIRNIWRIINGLQECSIKGLSAHIREKSYDYEKILDMILKYMRQNDITD